MIKAWAHSDDWAVSVGHPTYQLPAGKEVYKAAIDATPWFMMASDEQILDLVRAQWGGDYEADAIGHFLADKEPRLQELIGYCEVVSKWKDCGWEFYVDRDSAMQWLAQHRSTLIPSIQFIEAQL